MAFWTQLLDVAHGFTILGITIRFIFSTIVGTTIGIDREMKNRSAGIKTHVLVCLGACMVSTTSQYVSMAFQGVNGDINRLGAQVISGVGFLGVGTILVTGKNQVRGLTTAAGLWVCACVGLAVGIGFIEGATIAFLFIIFTLRVLNLVDNRIHMYARDFELYIEFENTKRQNSSAESESSFMANVFGVFLRGCLSIHRSSSAFLSEGWFASFVHCFIYLYFFVDIWLLLFAFR